MTHIKLVKKQIQENIEELKARAELNRASINNCKASNFRPAMYRDHEDELVRIAGMIDTYTSCYQMIDNR